MIENLVVAVIVALAFAYACSRYLPASWRERLVFALARRGYDQPRMARWLHTTSSCASGCDTCKSCADPAPPAEPAQRRVIKVHTRR
jgi:hypothetical protein